MLDFIVNSYMDSDINKRLRDVSTQWNKTSKEMKEWRREGEKRRRYRGRERERDKDEQKNYSMKVKNLIGREKMKRASLSYLLVFTADIGKEGRIIL